VLVILFLTDTTLNVQSYIGCIMLGGIVVNNAILLVDQANRLGATMPPKEAIAEAGRRRLRPILMTSLSFILGTMPLVLATGAGANARHSIGTGIIGGMIGATTLALFFVPLFYYLIQTIRLRLGGTRSEPASAQGT
jgi:HAE1 family hydrophobic/amphiphilic exporter-1